MIEITLFLIFVFFILLKPIIVPHFFLLYLFILGLASPKFIDQFKITFGSINVYPLDLLYVLAGLFLIIYFLKIIFNPEFKQSMAPETKSLANLFLVFIFFFLIKAFLGFLDGVSLETLFRLFINDTQIIYFYTPLVIYKDIRQLKSLLYLTVILALVFPICQPFLIGSDLTREISKGQGTFRLGYGDANVILGLGAIALFSWDYRKYLTFLPMAGIMMLAHRSAFIAVMASFLALSFLKGKKLKTMLMMAVAGIMVLAMLAVLQSFTNVKILDKNINRAEETFKYTGTTKARVGAMAAIFESFQDRPFTGFSYRELYDKTRGTKVSARDFNLTHPHNFVLLSLSTQGLIGLIFMLTFIKRSMFTAYKLAKTELFKTAGTFLFSSILFFVVYALMNTTMETSGFIFWPLCGITFMFLNELRKKAT